MADLSDIVVSKVRVKILNLFFSNPGEMYHVRGIVREITEEINAVRRELERMHSAGILKKEPRGNRIYYWIRQDYIFYGDLLAMVAKSTGLGEKIISNKTKLGKVSFVMFSGRFVRRLPRLRDSEIEILVIGEIVLPELANIIRIEESKRNQEINYTVIGREEFEFRKRNRDPFILEILHGSRIMIVGDEEDLVKQK